MLETKVNTENVCVPFHLVLCMVSEADEF